jgi:F-type H+-transporting ATPase subunit epsilon
MSDKKIITSIVTPEESVYEGEVDFISIPSMDGSMGILPGHIPVVCQLAIGIIKLVIGKESKYFAIHSGFLEFVQNRANILTGRAIVTSLSEKGEALKEIRKKHDIVQEITDETKRVTQVIASLKSLKK